MKSRIASGFTLIEMLVVMSIVALLLSIALPRYMSSLDKSKVTVLQENLRVLRLTLDRYYADKGVYPDTLTDLVEQKYLKSIPTDPFTETNQSWIVISTTGQDKRGIADVRSGAQGVGADGKSYGAL